MKHENDGKLLPEILPTGSMIIYVFGNGNISFDDFTKYYKDILTHFSSNLKNHFIVCDFRGTDTLTIEFLKSITPNVSLYHIGEMPRYMPDKYKTKASQWIVKGGFTSDKDRDSNAIEACTHFIAKDFNSNEKRKSGTLKNIQACIDKGKINLLENDSVIS